MTGRAYAFNSQNFAFEVFADEIVVLNVTDGTYFAFGGWAVETWPALVNRQPAQSIVNAMAERYGVAAGPIGAELDDFTAKLRQENILLDAQPVDEDIALETLPAASGFQPISFEKHADMQDLLTLDPIHDVDPQKGWPSY